MTRFAFPFPFYNARWPCVIVSLSPSPFIQLAVGKQLTTLEQKWTDLISSVLQIEVANGALEAEIATLAQREAELEQALAIQ